MLDDLELRSDDSRVQAEGGLGRRFGVEPLQIGDDGGELGLRQRGLARVLHQVVVAGSCVVSDLCAGPLQVLDPRQLGAAAIATQHQHV